MYFFFFFSIFCIMIIITRRSRRYNSCAAVLWHDLCLKKKIIYVFVSSPFTTFNGPSLFIEFTSKLCSRWRICCLMTLGINLKLYWVLFIMLFSRPNFALLIVVYCCCTAIFICHYCYYYYYHYKYFYSFIFYIVIQFIFLYFRIFRGPSGGEQRKQISKYYDIRKSVWRVGYFIQLQTYRHHQRYFIFLHFLLLLLLFVISAFMKIWHRLDSFKYLCKLLYYG